MKNWKVLLVDDEKEFVITLAERLGMRGIHTETVFEGEEALKKLETYEPDVMILDLMMPGIGGLTVLEKVKKLYPKIEVILLTGIGTTSEGLTGMRLGAYDYLMKPLQIEELIQKIGMAINKGSSTK
ncbi:MAG: response regulator [Pseudomonadota bacterium]